MKKKIIVALSALTVLAFPISSLAATNTTSYPYACSVADCQINGVHEHNANGTHNETGHRSHQNSSNGRHHR